MRPPFLISKILACVLALYATVYSVLLTMVFGMFDVFALLLLGMASTPFLALFAFQKVQARTAPALSIVMAVVMACPSLFWGALFVSEILSTTAFEDGFFWFLLLTAGVPALLSVWLCLTFVYIAIPKSGGIAQCRVRA